MNGVMRVCVGFGGGVVAGRGARSEPPDAAAAFAGVYDRARRAPTAGPAVVRPGVARRFQMLPPPGPSFTGSRPQSNSDLLSQVGQVFFLRLINTAVLNGRVRRGPSRLTPPGGGGGHRGADSRPKTSCLRGACRHSCLAVRQRRHKHHAARTRDGAEPE
ncbi:hypothetical protein SKAU_G00345710 [Synaphobranchus kaupii]|uniref:Uncharacterized protein n=1 Tax=Synaphobranchus kaupii TaxID=118154 RepID=A0A9Q1EJG3_SYNKA|nr:hypothetical protein SKAU_G00345710 [Synaphobranchus kaupii]